MSFKEADATFLRHYGVGGAPASIRATAPACVRLASDESASYFVGLDAGVVAVGRRTFGTNVSVVFACSARVAHRLYGGRRVERRIDLDVRSVARDPLAAGVAASSADAHERLILALLAHHNPESQDRPAHFHDAPPPCGFEAVVVAGVPPSGELGFESGVEAALALIVQAVCSAHGTATELLSDVLLRPSVLGDFAAREPHWQRCRAACSVGGASAVRVRGGDLEAQLLPVDYATVPLAPGLCVLVSAHRAERRGPATADVNADAGGGEGGGEGGGVAAACDPDDAATTVFDADHLGRLMDGARGTPAQANAAVVAALASAAREVGGVLGCRVAEGDGDDGDGSGAAVAGDDAAFYAHRDTIITATLVRAHAVPALRRALAQAAHPRPSFFAEARGEAPSAMLVSTCRVSADRASRRNAKTAARFERYAASALAIGLGIIVGAAALKRWRRAATTSTLVRA